MASLSRDDATSNFDVATSLFIQCRMAHQELEAVAQKEGKLLNRNSAEMKATSAHCSWRLFFFSMYIVFLFFFQSWSFYPSSKATCWETEDCVMNFNLFERVKSKPLRLPCGMTARSIRPRGDMSSLRWNPSMTAPNPSQGLRSSTKMDRPPFICPKVHWCHCHLLHCHSLKAQMRHWMKDLSWCRKATQSELHKTPATLGPTWTRSIHGDLLYIRPNQGHQGISHGKIGASWQRWKWVTRSKATPSMASRERIAHLDAIKIRIWYLMT